MPLVYLCCSSFTAFCLWITICDQLEKRRFARFARAKAILEHAALWLALDYTLGEDDAKNALLFLECAIRTVEFEELNFLVELGATA